MSGLTRRLVALAVAGLAAGVGALLLATSSEQEPDPVLVIVVAETMGIGFIGAGLYAWWRRPDNRTGTLMTLVGFTWFASVARTADAAWLFSIGNLIGALWIGALVHMLVAFPAGRVEPGLARRTVILGWATVIGLSVVYVLVTERLNDECDSCPGNVFNVVDSDAAVTATLVVSSVLSVVLLAGLGVLMIRRWRGAGPVQRRALAPVAATGAAIAVVGVLSAVPAAFGADDVSDPFNATLLILIAAVPFAFLAGLLRSSLSRAGAVNALFDRLGRVDARGALAQALGDDSLGLAYWVPDRRSYVDADGRDVALPARGRAVTEIERDGEPVAAIVHDEALLEDPELVRTAGAAAALALQNERLAAELHARYADLRAASARLVAAGDAARRRIERDLHDGAQQRLVSLSITLNLARNAAPPGSPTAELLQEASTELAAGLSELRELARGIHPAVLTERGLDPALESLAARAPLPVSVTAELDDRLAPAVEAAAYFVVMEALTNVAKYAGATTARVTVAQANGHVTVDVQDDGVGGADPKAGSGLAGLADRVTALGGRLVVESPPGGGTVVRAELPARRLEPSTGPR
ncbi:MAG TPA: histidine kinase [Solirubrobacteraceae bacterium]|nr:histidine kinase [Solirubrobacteraceae bacterium]